MNKTIVAIIAACVASASAGEIQTNVKFTLEGTVTNSENIQIGSIFYGFTVSNWISTNWVTIGTFTPMTGNPEDVQRGNVTTNTTAILEWCGKRFELLLESVTGPECGERRVAKRVTEGTYTWPQIWPWNSMTNVWKPGMVVTNLLRGESW